MTIIDRLEEMFTKSGTRYELFEHPLAISAQRVAQAEHVPGASEAKVVIVRVGGHDMMAVLPATHRVDLEKLKILLEAEQAQIVDERILRGLFPDCEVGAMPPFGHLYGLPVLLDRSFRNRAKIVFNAGSHTEAIRMQYEDYVKFANPLIGDFAVRIDQ